VRPVEGTDPLRDDIRLLGGMLGDTVREQAGAETFTLVESIRRTSVRFRREQEHEARLELESMLGNLDDPSSLVAVHAFTLFAQLSNIAEDVHVNRLEHRRESGGGPRREGSLELALERVRDAGVAAADVRRLLEGARIAPVLTAHPTEVQRKSILDRRHEIAGLLARRTRVALTPHERGGAQARAA
jgi:phosphoenolpyruvate carboxylase